MKRLLYILFLFPVFFCTGQINVGSVEYVTIKSGSFKDGDLEKLRKTTTLFVYRDADTENLETFKAALKSAWDFTELEFISWDEFKSNQYNDNYSFFTISGMHKVKLEHGMETQANTYFYLRLWMPGQKKDDLTFCRIELFPSVQTIFKTLNYNEKRSGEMMNHLYRQANLYNWYTGYLKNALQFVNGKLKNGEQKWLFESNVYESLTPIKRDTLFVPDYVMITFSPFTGDEAILKDPEKIFHYYPYPYKVI